MASQKCLCTPLLCVKCPSEYKTLHYLKQHLANKYRASRRQTSLVSQKHTELQMNCKKCTHNDHATDPWFPFICFPTEKILQDHMEVTHKLLNVGKCDRSGTGSLTSDCVCLKIFQCPSCPQSYNESSSLEKHWQEAGHHPKNRETVLCELQRRAKISKANCKECSRERDTKMRNDICSCRKTFICSVCLATFSCYSSLQKHWKMTSHHSAQDNQDELTRIKEIECPSCSPQIVRDCSLTKEETSDSPCSYDGNAVTMFRKTDAKNLGQLVDMNTKSSDVKMCNQYCSKMLLAEEQMSQCVNKMMVIDTDDTDNDSDEDVAFDSLLSSSVQPLLLPGNSKCNCSLLKCPICPASFSKCHDLYQHMIDVSHVKEHYFRAVRKKKKHAKSLCGKHANQEIVKEKKLDLKCSHKMGCNVVDMNESGRIELPSNFLKDKATRTLLSGNETMKSTVSDIQSRNPYTLESPSNTHINCSEDTSRASVTSSCDDETSVHLDSPMVEMKYGKDDFETDDTLVTITISEIKEVNGESNFEVNCSPAVQIVSGNSSSECPIDLKDCFQQCFKFISANCTCEIRNSAASSQEKVTGTCETTGCPTCCFEVNCFLCSSTFTSYYSLKKHFIKDHFLKDNSQELSNPSSEYISIVSEQLKVLNCICTVYECEQCKITFKELLAFLYHILLDHPDFYSGFSFFPFQKSGKYSTSCPRCTVFDKLRQVNYYLFIRVLMAIEGYSEAYAPLLQWCPPHESQRKSIDENGSKHSNEDTQEEDQYLEDSPDAEVVCYIIQPQTRFSKRLQLMKKIKNDKVSKCICPLLKCPSCPKTTATFGDLRKHTRINNHNIWNNMRVLWRKYKIIKEHCTACNGYSYLSYILCPHCPHVSFEDEDAAQAHMDSLHGGHTNKSTPKPDMLCTCTKQFLCMTCETYYRTSQGLHHHMRRLGHETRVNFDAIPGMIRKKMEDKKKCPRCSLFTSSKAQGVTSDDDQEHCTCKWAVCSTCGNSYKKISVLLEHMRKMKHPIDTDYIENEKKKLSTYQKACHKCNSMEDRYCIFCNTRENFIYHHMRTHHQDQQIFLLNGENGELLNEYDLNCKVRDIAKYECSICLKRFLHTTTLRRHVSKIHPDCYFTLQCIDLSADELKMENFTTRKEIKVLATVLTSGKGCGIMC